MPRLRSAPTLNTSRPSSGELLANVLVIAQRYRRIVAATFVAVALLFAFGAVAPARSRMLTVIAAAHDLPAGAVLHPDDVQLVRLPAASTPTGVLMSAQIAVGRATASPIRRGEPITDVRLRGDPDGPDTQGSRNSSTGAPLAPPGAGLVAVPVRLADVQAARLLRAGEHVDVLAALPSSGLSTAPSLASVIASDVEVVDPPIVNADPSGATDATDTFVGDGALVVLATTRDEARALAQAALTSRLSVVVVR